MLYGLRDSHSLDGRGKAKRCPQPPVTTYLTLPRFLLTSEEIDDFQTHTLDACPDCGGILDLVKDANRVVQQVEIVEKPVNIEQHAVSLS